MPRAAKNYRGNRQPKRKWDGKIACRAYHKLYGLMSWKDLRSSFLNSNPLCVECQRLGIVKVASIVDHVIPHKGETELFFDEKNLQSLCKLHHDRKTYAESLLK
jgi:5-methylcytosine-specific restriction protein A